MPKSLIWTSTHLVFEHFVPTWKERQSPVVVPIQDIERVERLPLLGSHKTKWCRIVVRNRVFPRDPSDDLLAFMFSPNEAAKIDRMEDRIVRGVITYHPGMLPLAGGLPPEPRTYEELVERERRRLAAERRSQPGLLDRLIGGGGG